MKFTLKKQIIILFLLVAAVSLTLLAIIMKTAIEKGFHDYVWTAQTDSHNKIVRYLENYYASFGSWKNFNGKEISGTAGKQKLYFSLYDTHNVLVYSTEENIEACCDNPNHKYWRNIYPVMANGFMTGWVNIGQFTDHIYSQEDIAFRRSIFYGIAVALAITLLTALPLAMALSARISRPVRDLKIAADAMAAGDLTVELKDRSSVDEISGLTYSINRLRKSLLKQENMRKELTSDISHELRTPVNIIQNQMEGMIDGVLETTPERLESILKEMERLTGLIGELEKIMEIESAGFTPVYEETDLSKTVRETAAGFEGVLSRKGISMIAEITPEIKIRSSKDKLTQCVLNIISNAYKFTDSGTITVRVFEKNGVAILEVEDTGRGIEEEHKDKIFERFYRVDKSRSRNTGGAGLGLAIVKTIADAYGWEIQTESEKGKGSLFRIIFSHATSEENHNA